MLCDMSEAWSAGMYERLAARFGPVQAELVEGLRIGPGDRVLDLATGTGEVAVRAAGRGAQVTGIDLAEPMLEKARRRAAEGGAAGTVVLGGGE
jgi:ubiquinone/menaquinone biosynthesis C-methylase UbiE